MLSTGDLSSPTGDTRVQPRLTFFLDYYFILEFPFNERHGVTPHHPSLGTSHPPSPASDPERRTGLRVACLPCLHLSPSLLPLSYQSPIYLPPVSSCPDLMGLSNTHQTFRNQTTAKTDTRDRARMDVLPIFQPPDARRDAYPNQEGGLWTLPCRHTLNDEPILRWTRHHSLVKGYKEAGISPLAYCFHLPRTDRPGWRVTTADAPFQVEKYDEQRSGG